MPKKQTISRSVVSSQILQNAEINIVVHWKENMNLSRMYLAAMDSYFVHYFEGGTKLRLPSEI